MTVSSTSANTLFGELVTGFPTLSFDLSGTDYALPEKTDNPLYADIRDITIEEVTEGASGTGAFDKLMDSLKDHLQEEFDSGRITGAEYTKAYIEMTGSAMSTAVSFVLQREQLKAQTLLTLMQARGAEIAAVEAGARLEVTKQELLTAQVNVAVSKTQYAIGKMSLAQADVTYEAGLANIELTDAQKLQVGAETDVIEYRLSDLLPEEKRNMVYQTDNVLPSQKAKVDYETNTVLPAQVSNINKDGLIKDSQLNDIMPAQAALIEEQTEVQRAQTLDTRSDNTTAVSGAIGRQKLLLEEQVVSYQKDARYKGAKLFTDAWTVQKSLDEDLLAPDQFTNANINLVVERMRDDLVLITPTP